MPPLPPVGAPDPPPAASRSLQPEGLVAGAGLRSQAARGTIVNAAFVIGLNLLGLVRGFVVAAFLTAQEYGLWGILFISFSTVLALKQGVVADKYIEQAHDDQRLAFQRAFTLELVVTGGFTLLMLAALPAMVVVYGQDDLLFPGLVLALSLPAVALTAPLWVYYRRMDFKRQRALQAVDPVVALVVTVVLAVAGAGYWSLVVGTAVGVWAGAAVAVAASPFPLALRYDRRTVREYAGFSWPLLVASGCILVVAQGSVLAGETEAGLAGAGAITLAALVSQYADRIDGIITGTLYPAICAVRDRSDLLFESFVKSNRLTLIWGVPFGVGLSLFASDLVEHVLGEHWRPAVVLLQTFGLTAAAGHLGFNWHAFYRARGVTWPIAVVNLLTMAAFLAAALPLLLSRGLPGFAAGIAIMTAVSTIARSYFLTRLFPGFEMVKHAARAVAPTIPAALTVALLRVVEEGDRGGGHALVELTAFVAVAAVATAILERALLREVAGYLGRPAAEGPRPT